jgi:hypothetical protein
MLLLRHGRAAPERYASFLRKQESILPGSGSRGWMRCMVPDRNERHSRS